MHTALIRSLTIFLKKIHVGMDLFLTFNSHPSAITKPALFNKRGYGNVWFWCAEKVKDAMSVDIQDVVQNSLEVSVSSLRQTLLRT